jgi:sulfide:quinone oxidoreductase
MTSAPRIVLAGGGPAAIEAALALRDLMGDAIELELIAPDRELVVRAYEVLAPFHEGQERRYTLQSIADDLDIHLVRDAVTAVNAGQRTLSLRSGQTHSYDRLVIAVGARQLDAVKGAVQFHGSRDASALRSLLIDSHAGRHRSVAFVVPGGRTWPLPVYELALYTRLWLSQRAVRSTPVLLVSPERRPLAAFGVRASGEVQALLTEHDVQFTTGHAIRHEPGRLLLAGGRSIDTELAVALSRLTGPSIDGLPRDQEGFIAVDRTGAVAGLDGVFAAGDATSFPVKQGGLATQQADQIARMIAAGLGAAEPVEPFDPVLRAVLFFGEERRYLLAELGDRLEQSSTFSETPLWTEPSKVVGRHLAPYLERLAPRQSLPIRS